MPNRRPRKLPPIWVEELPTVTCNSDGVTMVNQFGDDLFTYTMPVHRALNFAALISAAVRKWEREVAARPNNVEAFTGRKRPLGHG